MLKISRDEYTDKERERYGAAYSWLRRIIISAAPNAAVFRREFGSRCAAGFPVDFPDAVGNVLLYWAAVHPKAVRAGLPQILIDAGADVNKENNFGDTALGRACWWYVDHGTSEYMVLINTLLETGALPELDGGWEECLPGIGWPMPDQQARRDWLEAYFDSWILQARAGPEL